MAKSSGNGLGGLEETLDLYFNKKAPALPVGVKEFLVMIAPWITLVSVVISLPAVLALLGISSFVMPMSSYMGYANTGSLWMVSSAILVITIVLEALAIPGLFSRSKQGWNYVFYSSLIGIAANIISLNLIGGLIGAVISFYFLFQLRSHYR
ncbi:MAG TPA: chromate transporter [Patescibacteria group bacterium]|nr:chromate transporter [Patescibacteria group bacterium]